MNANDNIKVNLKNKDSLFRMIFGTNKSNALSLYNAINGSNYTNVDDLIFTTLDDIIYMKIKNDVSYLFDKKLVLYEHQSTFNPNMPLRGFLYTADLYRQLVDDSESIYGSKLIKIPTPQYIVFYNGPTSKMNCDKMELKLSDAFEISVEKGQYEWTAKIININPGFNEELKEKCSPLFEYSYFVDKTRELGKKMPIEKAVDEAVNVCIEKNILTDILSKHQREVKNMTLTEFNEEKYGELCRKEGREEGREEGRIKTLISLVRDNTISIAIAAEKLGIDEKEVKKLLAADTILSVNKK